MTFTQTINEIIKEILEFGFDSQERIVRLSKRLKDAYIKSILPEHRLEQIVREQLINTFDKLVKQKNLINPDVKGFTIQSIKPHLRQELDRRILASADLIKFRREESISNILRQFQGWATSIPVGGTQSLEVKKSGDKLKKMTKTERFNQRRISIDQTSKLNANIRSIIATDQGAIAGIWHSKGEHEPNYNARVDHLERAKKIYIIRDSWADKQGLIKPIWGYTDEITQPAEEVYCRCTYQYIFSLRKLPEDYLTVKGKNALESAKKQLLNG